MAYAQGDAILDTHYNDFAANGTANLNAIRGTGTGDLGYGQTDTISTVSDGNTITAAQWTSLLTDMTNVGTHQGTSITAYSNPVTTDPITFLADLSTNITDLKAGTCTAAGYQTAITATKTQSASWNTSFVHEQYVTFAGGNEARYFFNCGGKIQIDFSGASFSGDAKDVEWNDLVNTLAGTYEVHGNHGIETGGTGTPNIEFTTTGGYYDLTASYQVVYKMFADTGPYTSNYLQIEAKVNAADGDGLGNNGTEVRFKTTYNDAVTTNEVGHGIAGSTVANYQIEGDITTTLSIREATSASLTDGEKWGVPTATTV